MSDKMKLKTILSTIVIGLLLTTSIASVDAFKINEEIEDAETSEPYFHAIQIPFANVYVDDDNTQGPWDGTYEYPYQFIQEGIDNADDSDIVYVFNGTYNENVVIDKSITLRGESNVSTVITDTVKITTNHVTVSKFKITNVEGCSIKSLSNYNTIEKNIITGIILNYYGNGIGIYSNGDFNTIKENTIKGIIRDNTHSYIIGIDSNGDFNTIKENTITDITQEGYYGNIIGIDSNGDFNTIKNNVISNLNSEAGTSTGIYCEDDYNTIEDNNLTSINSGPGWARGISLLLSSNSTIKGNTIDKSNVGIELIGGIQLDLTMIPTDYTTISENNIFNCRIGWDKHYFGGIRLVDATNNNITNNNFKGNTIDAYFEFSYVLSENESYEMNEIPENFDEPIINSNVWDQNYWGRPRVLPKIINGKLIVFENLLNWYFKDYLYKVSLINVDSNPLLNSYYISQNSQPSSQQSTPRSSPSSSPTSR